MTTQVLLTAHHAGDPDQFRRLVGLLGKFYLAAPVHVRKHVGRLDMNRHGVLTVWWGNQVPGSAIACMAKLWVVMAGWAAPADHRSQARGTLLSKVRDDKVLWGHLDDVQRITQGCQCCSGDLLLMQIDAA